jgi:hypothetical protein
MGWILAHKLLLVVYGAAIVLAAFELSDPDVRADKEDDPSVYLEPDTNVADVSAAVHPDRGLTLYYQAQQAAHCSQPGARELPVCRARGPVRPGEVRELLEEAIETGNRSLELAMYNYAWVLLEENAPPEEVAAAVAIWRDAHPNSRRPDPREAHWARTRQAPAASPR